MWSRRLIVLPDEALLIFWLTAGVAVLLLQYGPGRSFYEPLDLEN